MKSGNLNFLEPSGPLQAYNGPALPLGDQLDAQFFYIICLFQSSTCFEQTRDHHQEVNCINTASGIVTLCKWPSGMQVEQFLLDLHTGRGVTIPDAVLIPLTS